VGSGAQKPAISPKRYKIDQGYYDGLIESRIRAFDTRFRLVPKSMTLDDLKRPKRTLVEKSRITEPTRKKLDYCQRQNAAMPLLL